MSRSTADALRWSRDGTRHIIARASDLGDDEVRGDSSLPGWTVGQLVAHVAANADALTNLARWARTGVETPMYESVESRDAAIRDAIALTGDDLRRWLERSATTLSDELALLDERTWSSSVRTIQGRELPATEIPWLRAREVYVHAVDLDRGLGFADLPDDFLRALEDDILIKRGLPRTALPDGDRAQRVAWLAGRPTTLPGVAPLGPWL